MKGQLGLALYAEGLENGDVQERLNEDGKMMSYMRKEKRAGKRKAIINTTHAAKQAEFSADKWMTFAASIASEAEGWCKFGLGGVVGIEILTKAQLRSAQSGGGSGKVLEDAAVARAQQAYDQCTRTMSSIRTASRELLLLVPADSLQASSTRECLMKARSMEPHSARLEQILFDSDHDHEKIRSILQAAAPVYQDHPANNKNVCIVIYII